MWVDPNPMAAYQRPLSSPPIVRDDCIRRQLRHVAVHTLTHQCMAPLGKEAATLGLMTLEAPAGEDGGVALRSVHVVAGGAGHRRFAEAAAPLQQRYLIPVHIHVLLGQRDAQREVRLERRPWPVREGGGSRRANPTVAERAPVYLAGAREPRRVHDRVATNHAERRAQ